MGMPTSLAMGATAVPMSGPGAMAAIEIATRADLCFFCPGVPCQPVDPLVHDVTVAWRRSGPPVCTLSEDLAGKKPGL